MRPHEVRAVRDHLGRHAGWYVGWLLWLVFVGGELIALIGGDPALGAVVGVAPGALAYLLLALNAIVLRARTTPERRELRREVARRELAEAERDLGL